MPVKRAGRPAPPSQPLPSTDCHILIAGFDVNRFELTREQRKMVFSTATTIFLGNCRIAGIEGRASETGSANHNEALSLKRANAVNDYLRPMLRSMPLNYPVVGLGARHPLFLFPAETPQTQREEAHNRSVLIKIIPPPYAIAGGDQHIHTHFNESYTVTLDGSQSKAPLGRRIVNYRWVQEQHVPFGRDFNYLRSPYVEFSDQSPGSPTVSFVIPPGAPPARYLFRLTVTDDFGRTSSAITNVFTYHHQPDPGPSERWGIKLLLAGSFMLPLARRSRSFGIRGRPASAPVGGPTSPQGASGESAELAVGLTMSFGQLHSYRRNRSCLIVLYGIKFGAVNQTVLDTRNLPDMRSVRQIWERLSAGVEAGNPNSDFSAFQSNLTEFSEFDDRPVLIGNGALGIRGFGIALQYLKFLTCTTNPEWIDIGGPQFAASRPQQPPQQARQGQPSASSGRPTAPSTQQQPPRRWWPAPMISLEANGTLATIYVLTEDRMQVIQEELEQFYRMVRRLGRSLI